MEPRGHRHSDRLTENVSKLADDTLEPWSARSDVRSSFDNPTDINNIGNGQDNFFSTDTTNHNMHFDFFGYSTPDSSPNSLYYQFPFTPNYERPPYESPEEVCMSTQDTVLELIFFDRILLMSFNRVTSDIYLRLMLGRQKWAA
jgi:hypothetical protein